MTDETPAYDAEHDTIDLAALAGGTLPRRFAICTYSDDGEPSLRYWGLQAGDTAIGFGCGAVHSAASAERIARRLSLVYDVELVWLDPPLTSGVA
jgi:hypothetical protein